MPFWEITILLAAGALILAAVILWSIYGYSYVVVPGGTTLNLPA